MALNLLLVEDDDDVIDTYRSTIEVYQKKNNCLIELIICTSVDECLEPICDGIDAAIVDLKLGVDPEGGNKVLSLINEKLHRIPVVVLTGTPDETDKELPFMSIHKKGGDFAVILDELYSVYGTGITKIFGGRGVIEETMDKVFWDSVLPQVDTWKQYASNGIDIEKALIRYTISHLYNLLENDVEACIPEEMYIRDATTRTGSILKNKETGNYHIVVSPACDMVEHENNGCYKTNKVALCEIEDHDTIIDLGVGETGVKKQPKIIKKIITNNENNYHHWLPKSHIFPGGFINMRHFKTYEVSEECNEIIEKFELPSCVISPHFMKDIISRLSAYYARQGQPNFNFSGIAQAITDLRN